MQYLRHPLIGDPTYGGTYRHPPGGTDEELVEQIRHFPRQALHAGRLSFNHPISDKQVNFEVDLPADMSLLLDLLKKDD